MLLFKPWHVEPILNGEKTQTRRFWKKSRVREESIQKAKLQIFTKEYFAKLRILRVWQERLGDITKEDAKKEGGYGREDFLEAICEINGLSLNKETLNKQVWAVEFGVVE